MVDWILFCFNQYVYTYLGRYRPMTITNRLTNEDTQEIATSHLHPLLPLCSVETTTVMARLSPPCYGGDRGRAAMSS
jgi:hypothetical protein